MMRDSLGCAQSQPQRIANVFVSHFSNEFGLCGRLKMTSNSLTFFFFQEVGFLYHLPLTTLINKQWK